MPMPHSKMVKPAIMSSKTKYLLTSVILFITLNYKLFKLVKYMREILTISIDSKLKEKVEKAAEKFNVSKSELVKKAIEKYILHEEFQEIRSMLIPFGEKAGYFTDEDIFKDFS